MSPAKLAPLARTQPSNMHLHGPLAKSSRQDIDINFVLCVASLPPPLPSPPLQKRASEAVDVKNMWWNQRKAEAEEVIGDKGKAAFSPLPVPQWTLGKPVSLDNMKKVTDAYFKALEPAKKLKVPSVPAQVTQQLGQLAKTTGQDGEALQVSSLG